MEFRRGLAEELPAPDGSVDLAIFNGVINLCTDKYRVFQEMYRILKPGGRPFLADIGGSSTGSGPRQSQRGSVDRLNRRCSPGGRVSGLH